MDFSTSPILVPPKINAGALMDIRVRAGVPIHLIVPFEAEPQPTAEWKHDDKVMDSGSHAEIVTRDGQTEVSCRVKQKPTIFRIRFVWKNMIECWPSEVNIHEGVNMAFQTFMPVRFTPYIRHIHASRGIIRYP